MPYNWPNWWRQVAEPLAGQAQPARQAPVMPCLFQGMRRLRHYCGGLLLLWLAVYSPLAAALGLGSIRVLSQPGEPLIAEIPLLSNNPEELDGATAGLAAADTFVRVGLPRPRGQVRELQFEFTQDRHQRAVIRVSTDTPLQTPALSFLIEVNWGQGRIVREYSTLASAPDAMAAVNEPIIEYPEGGQSNLIIRDVGQTSEPITTPLNDQWPALAGEAPASAFESTTTPATPPRTATPPSAFVSSSTTTSAGTIKVQRGQTLGQIAGELSRGNGQSLDQTMIALLRANPQAFINDNLNLLREGAVLRVPASEELTALTAAQAHSMVREHMTQWQQVRHPVPQLQVANNQLTEPSIHTVPLDNNSPMPGGARLEIATAVANQSGAGAATGIDPQGDGDRLGVDALRQTVEDLASREVELQELRDRVGQLEALQAQQRALIEMKDSELAAAQQRLAEASQHVEEEDAPSSGGFLWAIGVLALLSAAGAGAWLLHRRKQAAESVLDMDEFEDLDNDVLEADALALDEENTAPSAASSTDTPAAVEMTFSMDSKDHSQYSPPPLPAIETPVSPPAAAPSLSVEANQYAHAFSANDDENVLEPIGSDHQERLELAIAYLDLGDTRTARSLLTEVAQQADSHLRREAMELLARLN